MIIPIERREPPDRSDRPRSERAPPCHRRPPASTAARSCPTYGAAAGAVRAGRRAPSCGTATATRYLDFLSGLAVIVARPRPPRGRRRARRAGRHAAARLEPVRHRARRGGGRHPRPAARRRGPGLLLQLGCRGQRGAIKLARKLGGRGRHVVVSAYGSFHGRTLATLHATGQPAKHEAVPAPARGLPPRRLERPRRARAAPSTRRSPRCCSSRCRARAASTRRPPSTSRACARLCDERGILFMVDEVQTGLGRTGRWFGHQHFGVRARRRDHGQGARQRRADRRLLGPARGRRRLRARRPRHHLRRPAAGRRGGPGRARGHGARGRPGLAAEPGERLTDGAGRLAGVAEVRGLGPARSPPSSSDGVDAKAVGRGRLAAGLVVNAVTPTALRLAPPLLISDDEIDEAVAILARCCATAAARPRRRRMRHLLEIDDLTADELRDGARPGRATRRRRRCWPARAWRCCSRSRRPAPATRWRWRSSSSAATRSPSGPTRSVSTSARPPRTSPARWPATTPPSAPGSFEHAKLERMAAVDRGAGRQPALRRCATRCRRWPTCSPSASSSAPSPAARSPTSATATTWPVAGPGRRHARHGACGVDARRATGPSRRGLDAPRAAGVDRVSVSTRRRGRRRRRRRLHRRVDVDGPGGRGRRAPRGLRGLHRRRRR